MKTNILEKDYHGIMGGSGVPQTLVEYILSSDEWTLLFANCQRPGLYNLPNMSDASWTLGVRPAVKGWNQYRCYRWVWQGPENIYYRTINININKSYRMLGFVAGAASSEYTNYMIFQLTESEWEKITGQFEQYKESVTMPDPNNKGYTYQAQVWVPYKN